jgi:hypothetical protein
VVTHYTIKTVAVQYQIPSAVGGNVNGFFQELNVSQDDTQPDVLTQKLVMVAGDVDDFCALARFAQNFCTTTLCAEGQYQRLESRQPSMMSPTR